MEDLNKYLYFVDTQEGHYLCETHRKAKFEIESYLFDLDNQDYFNGDEFYNLYILITNEAHVREGMDEFILIGENVEPEYFTTFRDAFEAKYEWALHNPDEETTIYGILERGKWETLQERKTICIHPDYNEEQCEECNKCDFCGTDYESIGSVIVRDLKGKEIKY